MAELRDLDPRPHYRIVGRTHPVVARKQGVVYRRMLEGMVREHGVDDMVEFVDRYLDDDELSAREGSHIVVTPYENSDQVTSGVLTDAVAAGRPVVATRFPHAVELVGPGPGLVVDHDSVAIAEVACPHDDAGSLRPGRAGGRRRSSELSWQSGATRYADFIRRLIPNRVTASR